MVRPASSASRARHSSTRPSSSRASVASTSAPECVTGLAKTARVGSKAAEALRFEYENELAERDARVNALAEQLRVAERNLAEQREQSVRSQEALDQARVLASQAVGSLQQIGQ